MSAIYCCCHLAPAERVDEFDLCQFFDARIDPSDCGPLCPGFASAHAVTERVSDAGYVLPDAGDDETRASEGE